MKIIFNTPDPKKTAKQEIKIKKLAFILLQNFYINLKTEIVNGFKYNKKVVFDNFQLELILILKTIYSLYSTNYINNSLLKNFTKENIQNNDTEDLLDQKLQEIIDNVNDNINLKKNNFFEQLATKQALIILSNIQSKVSYLYDKAKNNSYKELQNIEQELLNIQNELYEINILPNTLQVNKAKTKLEAKQKEYKNKRSEYSNINVVSLVTFSVLYEDQIENIRAASQAENEVNLISNRYNTLEAGILSEVIKINPNINQSTVSEFKEWDSTLDSETRLTHANANGQIVNKDELFIVYNPDTSKAEYTQEPMGEGLSMNNIVNCRCKVKRSIEFTLK